MNLTQMMGLTDECLSYCHHLQEIVTHIENAYTSIVNSGDTSGAFYVEIEHLRRITSEESHRVEELRERIEAEWTPIPGVYSIIRMKKLANFIY